MKRFFTLLLAAVMLWGLCACGDDAKDGASTASTAPSRFESPGSAEDYAAAFIRAYHLQDRATEYAMMFHDARQEWVDIQLKSHETEEAFCAVVQQQADEQGLDVDIQSFDDYLREYYNLRMSEMEDTYGTHTVTSTVTQSLAMSAERLAEFKGQLSTGFFSDYIDDAEIEKITEGHTISVDFRIDGDKKDYHATHTVYVVLYDGQWRVGSYTT